MKVVAKKDRKMPDFNNQRKAYKYPWETMNVGEYFEVAGANPQSYIHTANQKYKPKKFDYERGSQRIWRVK